MNLNEAAETMRQYHRLELTESEDAAVDEANSLLVDTMLAWLDPTPLTEEWLRENGLEIDSSQMWSRGKISIWKRVRTQDWVLYRDVWTQFPIKTLGELRMLLRLIGEA